MQQSPLGRFGGLCLAPGCCLLGILCSAIAGHAAALTWDANGATAPNPSDGSGKWQGSGLWWNGSANQSWGDGNDAVFGVGGGAVGSYLVTNSSALVQPNSVSFNAPGSYTITTDGVNAGQLAWTAAGSGVGASSRGLWVGTNVSVRIDAPWRDVNGGDIFLGSNSVLTFSQGSYGSQGTLVLKGSGAAASVINVTNGVWGGATGSLLTGTMDISGICLNISGAAVLNVGTRLDIGRPATGAMGSDGIINVGDGGQLNVNATTATDPNANLQISRSGAPGTLNILAGGFVSTSSGGNSGRVELIPDSVTQASLNVSGGVLSVGTGSSGRAGARSSFLSLITLMQGAMTYGSSASAILNFSSGVISAQGIQIGSSSGNFAANPTNQINMTGGTLYLDALNISQPRNTGSHLSVNLSGGTVAATADWWPACAVPINLTNINGDITFQAADANGVPFNLAFAGGLGGAGGFQKTGGGTLTLSGTNSFAGATVINGGAVLLTGAGSISYSSTFAISNGGALVLMNSAAANRTDRLSNATPITLNGGAFSLLNDGSTAVFSESVGTLSISSGTNVITVYPATNGQSSTLVFSALAYGGGCVDFQMSAAGTSQNRILFSATPALGNWITVNGKPAAYDSVNGLREAASYTDIAALGSTIPNAAASDVRINSMGSGGNIQLAAAADVINSLQQNTATRAVVDTAGKALRVNQITVNAGAQALTLGAAPGSGMLTCGSSGGNLVLVNRGGFAPGLVINSVVADNGLPSGLTVIGGGAVTLAAPNNTYSGGTTLSNSTLAVTAGTTVAMPFTNFGGTLLVKLGTAGPSLPMNGLTAGGSNPQLTFDLNGQVNGTAPIISLSGNLALNSDIRVNATNLVPGTCVLLQYSGTRSGSGRFLKGNLPAGAGIVDDPVSKQVTLVYFTGPTVLIPTHNTNEIVVVSATPQQYGAVGDGATDDSGAFQAALNAVSNPGGVGGGVVFVPSGTYAFSNNIAIPPGVTLQGDWQDWSLGSNGVVGTLFKVYVGAGQSNGLPFITINQSALKGVSIWYPNQTPGSITPYPFTIFIENGNGVVHNVALINPYQGISCDNGPQHIISEVFGTPLYTGIQVDDEYDISHQEEVRFSPDFWPASKLAGAPATGGAHAAWMRSYGAGERLYRADGEACMNVMISGYSIGIDGLYGANGNPDASLFGCVISNCATAYLDAAGGGNTGMEFTRCSFDGDIAVDRNTANDASAYFHTCQFTGHSGVAIRQTGGSSSTMQFQNCTVSGAVRVDGGIANFVNSSFTVPASSNHCIMSSGAIYAAFTGCSFTPTRKVSNAADARRLVIDGRRASSSPLPDANWADIQADWLTRRPAKLDLFIVTNAAYGAVGDGVADDTAAIQGALNAAAANGGGIVYLPPGKFKLTGTLDVAGGVELRGSYPSRHSPSLYDGHVKVSLLQPYGGAGTTNGPAAVALEANAGIVGVSFSYELQDTNATPYPPTIQGRGPNVYAYGIMCPNAYWYVDLNTYTCTNHFFYDVDGWALHNAFIVGNGSSGAIIECMANSSYWGGNTTSASVYTSAWQPAILNFVEHNLDWFVLGDCTELMVKNFEIFSHTFMHCVSQNGRGPWITGILTMCDGSVECYRFDSAAPSLINIVNPEWMVSFSDYSDMTNYGVISTPAFQGTARFFNAPLWGARPWDYLIQGGDIGFELAHMGYLSTYGTEVDGGVVHLINCGFEGNTSAYYTVPFTSASAGVPGKLSEIIGCYAWTGVAYARTNASNPVNAWGNFGINKLVTQTPLDVSPPRLQVSRSAADQTLSLTWSNNMGAFNLYAAPSLSAPRSWSGVTNMPSFGGNQWIVTLPYNNLDQQYFRLQQK